jgi:superoxide dismutase, Cu-Zn family
VPIRRRPLPCVLLCMAAALSPMAVHSSGQASQQTGTQPGATADILSPVEESIGKAQFFAAQDGVRIELNVVQQVPGMHGWHILSAGKCEGPDFKSAGPHFNPFGKKHGMENPDGPHAGDLPNFQAGMDGRAMVSILAKGVTLGPGPNSLLAPGGTSIALDEGIDDYKTDPDGNSGAHIDCGVIVTAHAKTRSQ